MRVRFSGILRFPKAKSTAASKGMLHTLEATIAFMMVVGFIVFAMPAIDKERESSTAVRLYVYEALSNMEKMGTLQNLVIAENLSGIKSEVGKNIAVPLKFTVGMSKSSITYGKIYPKEWEFENSTYEGYITLQRKVPSLNGNSWVLGYNYASDSIASAAEVGGYFNSPGNFDFSNKTIDSSASGMCIEYNASGKYWWAHLDKEPGNQKRNFYIEFNTSSANDPDRINFTIDILDRKSTPAEDPDCSPYNDPDLTRLATDVFYFNDGTGILAMPHTIRASPPRAPGYVNFTADKSTLDSATLRLKYINASSPIIYVNDMYLAQHTGDYSGNEEAFEISSYARTGANSVMIKTANNATISYRLMLTESRELEAPEENKSITTISYVVSGNGSAFAPSEVRVYTWK